MNAATMRGIGYQPGTTGLRTLAADDIQGICGIYPPGETIGSECNAAPRLFARMRQGRRRLHASRAAPADEASARRSLAALFGLGF